MTVDSRPGANTAAFSNSSSVVWTLRSNCTNLSCSLCGSECQLKMNAEFTEVSLQLFQYRAVHEHKAPGFVQLRADQKVKLCPMLQAADKYTTELLRANQTYNLLVTL